MPLNYMTDYISINVILDDILHHPLLRDVTPERAINYTIRFIQLVGMPQMFIDKTEFIHIDNHRGELPCDFYEITQVRDNQNRAFIHSSDSFHMSKNKHSHDLTYKIQGRCIFTSIKDGDIEISYKAIAIDQDGYPLIPDNSSFILALEAYIKKQHFTILFDQGKLQSGILQNAQQEYAWYVGQCQNSLIKPTIDQMQSITNMLNTLITRVTEHDNGFNTLDTREYIKRH